MLQNTSLALSIRFFLLFFLCSSLQTSASLWQLPNWEAQHFKSSGCERWQECLFLVSTSLSRCRTDSCIMPIPSGLILLENHQIINSLCATQSVCAGIYSSPHTDTRLTLPLKSENNRPPYWGLLHWSAAWVAAWETDISQMKWSKQQRAAEWQHLKSLHLQITAFNLQKDADAELKGAAERLDFGQVSRR